MWRHNPKCIDMNNTSKKGSNIGKNIKRLRKELDISQDTLSKKAGLAFHTVVKIEAGTTPNPTIDTVKKISGALGVSLDEIME